MPTIIEHPETKEDQKIALMNKIRRPVEKAIKKIQHIELRHSGASKFAIGMTVGEGVLGASYGVQLYNALQSPYIQPFQITPANAIVTNSIDGILITTGVMVITGSFAYISNMHNIEDALKRFDDKTDEAFSDTLNWVGRNSRKAISKLVRN